jgi:hypothetical protein
VCREALPWGWSEMSAVRLPDGKVFVAGGVSILGEPSLPYSKAMLASPDFNSWDELPNLPTDTQIVKPSIAFAVSSDKQHTVLLALVKNSLFM